MPKHGFFCKRCEPEGSLEEVLWIFAAASQTNDGSDDSDSENNIDDSDSENNIDDSDIDNIADGFL